MIGIALSLCFLILLECALLAWVLAAATQFRDFRHELDAINTRVRELTIMVKALSDDNR